MTYKCKGIYSESRKKRDLSATLKYIFAFAKEDGILHDVPFDKWYQSSLPLCNKYTDAIIKEIIKSIISKEKQMSIKIELNQLVKKAEKAGKDYIDILYELTKHPRVKKITKAGVKIK